MIAQIDQDLIPKGALPYFQSNPNVLVIDDDRFMIEVFLGTLGDIGFQVTISTNGTVALTRLQQQATDFIILDLLLPDMNGFELFRRLKKNRETADIPVIMVTAWGDTIHRKKAAEVGIEHFLTKPFTEDELLEAIFKLLVAHKTHRYA
jgi:two-component system phosphate regulon response regulator PhoB